VNLLFFFYFAFSEWPIERRSYGREKPDPEAGTDDGAAWLNRAANLDREGRRDAAVAIYQEVLDQEKYRRHHDYARNCLAQVRDQAP
jgi:hypothetical protein